jgi:hypothetical protein
MGGDLFDWFYLFFRGVLLVLFKVEAGDLEA